jgi:CRISPR-associated protein Csx16
MTTYFITRHEGAKMWAEEEGFKIDVLMHHFDPKKIQLGDRVLGTLPVNLVADVCQRGGVYYHLILNMPSELRGKELSAQDMRDCDARLEPYLVAKGWA